MMDFLSFFFFPPKVECSNGNLFIFHPLVQSRQYVTPVLQFVLALVARWILLSLLHSPAEVKPWGLAMKQTDFGHLFSG